MGQRVDSPVTRPEIFAVAETWVRPDRDEMLEFLRAHGGCHPDGRPRTAWLAVLLGLGKRGDRTIRGWLAGERNGQPSAIPYTAWFTLVEQLDPGRMQRA